MDRDHGEPQAVLAFSDMGRGAVVKRLLGLIGLGVAAVGLPAAAQSQGPYAQTSAANEIYDLLFCDDLSALRPQAGAAPADWQAALFGPEDPVKVAALARDEAQESRVRALAYRWLAQHGKAVPKGVVLGVVIEVPLDHGLDVLAAFSDGSVRYINQSGGMALVEPDTLPEISRQARRLVELAQPVAAQIGPWDKARLPAPAKPDVRLSFIVSDGLYFGQGPIKVIERDPMAGPLLLKGAQLVKLLADKYAPE